jgi:hypothetical protein
MEQSQMSDKPVGIQHSIWSVPDYERRDEHRDYPHVDLRHQHHFPGYGTLILDAIGGGPGPQYKSIYWRDQRTTMARSLGSPRIS